MASYETRKMTETEVVRLWQEQMRRSRHLTDSKGRLVEVVYPGRLNDTRGGDFRDALVNTEGECKSGCIEIHTHASGWRSHGHHRDPAYNGVVLHVALEEDQTTGASLQNGLMVPTVILDQYIHPPSPRASLEVPCLCHGWGQKPDRENQLIILDKAGEQRLDLKFRHFQTELAQQEAEQTLYQGILEALGYAKNQTPFRELARRAPLRWLENVIAVEHTEAECLIHLQAVLLGIAGLLPSQRTLAEYPEIYVHDLERIWAASPYPPMSSSEWEFFKIRPGNYPVRRIAALSYLICRYREKGWLPSLVESISQLPPQGAHRQIEPGLTVNADDYWINHYDFGPAHTTSSSVLLGKGRSASILINVLLPFTLAWGQMMDKMELCNRVREIYRRYPRLESNSLEQHMLQQLALNTRQVNSACRQQGLIHIYKTQCTQGKCNECDLATNH